MFEPSGGTAARYSAVSFFETAAAGVAAVAVEVAASVGHSGGIALLGDWLLPGLAPLPCSGASCTVGSFSAFCAAFCTAFSAAFSAAVSA